MNRFKGLDLEDRVPEELWTEVCNIVQEAGITTIPKGKKCKKAKIRVGANCGLDHELLIAKFRLKLKKVGKTIRPLRYDLNQIPYDSTVEVTNRFNILDLIDRMPDELWTEVCNIVQEAVIKTIPKKKKCNRQNDCLRRPYE